MTLEENREYMRLRRLAFPAIDREINLRSFHKKNPANLRMYMQLRRLALPQVCRDIRMRSYYNNREVEIAGTIAWQKRNPDKKRATNRRWKKQNFSKVYADCAKRRARKRNALLPGQQWEIDDIYTRRDWWIARGFDVVVDHIFDLGFGWHEPANLQIIYAADNAIKNCANPYYKPKVIFL